MRRLRVVALAGVTAFGLGGCASLAPDELGYYWQSVRGHLGVMNAARPVAELLAGSDTPAALRDRLALAQRIRAFAATELQLPDNASYTRYADLRRRAVVWNVVAAPPYSLRLHTWCFPVAGCVGYRGYYDEAAAAQEAARMAQQGLEVAVQPIPAYSTLGWSNWFGGDPLLNTFIAWPEGDLARLIFHELAHQVAYARDDTMFNESFATAVERLGVRRWLDGPASAQAREAYERAEQRRAQFRALTLVTRRELEQVYSRPEGPAHTQAKAQAKAQAMQRLRDGYAALRASWGGPDAQHAGFDAWIARANNATLGAQAAYDELVPAFEALYQREGADWRRFYDAVRRLAALPDAQSRRAALAPGG